jgi:hypothetical protein
VGFNHIVAEDVRGYLGASLSDHAIHPDEMFLARNML